MSDDDVNHTGPSSEPRPGDGAEKSDSTSGGERGTSTATQPKSRPRRSPGRRRKPRKLPPYNVVLLDDDDHSYEYVIEMLRCLFGYPIERGFQIADEVDLRGRAVVVTTHKELAELKRDQIRAYGADVRVATSRGSMSAIIEPAEKRK
jgi:ATP-dependent Clp protease adaptor protein ClpS